MSANTYESFLFTRKLCVGFLEQLVTLASFLHMQNCKKAVIIIIRRNIPFVLRLLFCLNEKSKNTAIWLDFKLKGPTDWRKVDFLWHKVEFVLNDFPSLSIHDLSIL